MQVKLEINVTALRTRRLLVVTDLEVKGLTTEFNLCWSE